MRRNLACACDNRDSESGETRVARSDAAAYAHDAGFASVFSRSRSFSPLSLHG